MYNKIRKRFTKGDFMSVSFKSDPFLDAVIFSGVDVKDVYDHKYSGKMEFNETEKVAQAAFANIDQSYEDHKAHLDQNLKYDQFLKNVEGSISKFKQPEISSKVRQAVATKLSIVANDHIQTEKNQLTKVEKFFHKMSQLCQGHGFRTEGEWGVELASRMKKVDFEINKSQLEKCIIQGQGYLHPHETLDAMKEDINSLSEAEFKKVINDVIFNKKEKLSTTGDKNKLHFYNNLNDEKKEIFNKILSSRSDRSKQIDDIIEGSHDIKKERQRFESLS